MATLNVAGITINGALIHNVEYETFAMDSVPGPIKIIHIHMRDSVKIEVRVIQDQRSEFPVAISSPSVSWTTVLDEDEFDTLYSWLHELGYLESEWAL
jgi:hypothetical protein